MSCEVGIGLLGFGNVGSGVAQLIARNGPEIEAKTGLKLVIRKALVRNTENRIAPDGIGLTISPSEVLFDSEVDVIVEVMGGLEPAQSLVKSALLRGKSVITANKTLIAESGLELQQIAEQNGIFLRYEAAVCGGIPLIRMLKQGLAANQISSMVGILNGTSNFILSKMHSERMGYEAACNLARENGYAEPDPAFDVDGTDVVQKLSILIEDVFRISLPWSEIPHSGITYLHSHDIEAAEELGYVIRLLAIADIGENGLDARVHPAFVPQQHPLAHVQGADNAVLIEGNAVGSQMVSGAGAGPLPTASAILSDVLEVVAGKGTAADVISPRLHDKQHQLPESGFYIRVPIPDRPGAIGSLATILADYGISISHATAVLNENRIGEGQVRMLTHPVTFETMETAMRAIRLRPELQGEPVMIPLYCDQGESSGSNRDHEEKQLVMVQ